MRYLLALLLLCAPFAVQAKNVQGLTGPSGQNLQVERTSNPEMQVMVGVAPKPAEVTASGKFIVENEAGKVLFVVKAGKSVSVKYNEKKQRYVVQKGSRKKRSKTPVSVTPLKLKGKHVTVSNWNNYPAWDTARAYNDNYFAQSVRFAWDGERMLIINDIGLEAYVAGIAEIANSEAFQYIKTFIVAARTYALWHIQNPTKHADKPYTLTATEGDQIYRGKGFRDRADQVRRARKKTKHQVVLYKGDPIIAAYFSRSDGRTRSWEEVWGAKKPWAVGVDDPCCTSETLWGHGVGLSGEGARYFANEKNWKYKKILKYYYTGVKVKKY